MENLLLVYTMGKVASTTISESLTASRIDCHDIHTLRKESLILQLKKNVENNTIPHNHIGRSINIYRDFQSSKKIKIITCVRDSFSRNISAIFQNLPKTDYTLTKLQKIIQGYPPDAPGSWLSNEFQKTTGINIIEKDFSIAKKYDLFTDGRYEVLVMRTDLSNDTKQELVSNFVGEKITLINKNEAQNKWYKELYENFLRNGCLSEEWILKCIKSNYMDKFYSKEEQDKYNLDALNFLK
jgi:hypothetical protein